MPRIKTGCLRFSISIASLLLVPVAYSAGNDVARIGGEYAKTLLGDGTGVIVGIIDSGVDDTHPALAGFTSGGLPRMKAEANFVPSEPTNTGDDVFGHGTAVAGAILSRDSTNFAVATDARYVNARVIDSNNVFDSDSQVLDGVGFALQQGSNILNTSLGYFNYGTSGDTPLALMADYVVSKLGIPVVVSAGNAGEAPNPNTSAPSPKPQGPGDACNVFSVGATDSSYGKMAGFSSYGPTTDGRLKPDISAPGENVITANSNWETQSTFVAWSGTSLAAPNVTGILAAQMEYGRAHGLSIDPRVLKATLLNSAEKVRDRDNQVWAPNNSTTIGGLLTTASPLDNNSGAGQVNALALCKTYSAGRQGPGMVSTVGWDFHNLETLTYLEYQLGTLRDGSELTATLNWNREVNWIDNGNRLIDGADTFSPDGAFENLDLSIFRNGLLLAQSTSTVDSVEQLYLSSITQGDYVVRVSYVSGDSASVDYGLAWSGAAIPEPSTIILLLSGGCALCLVRYVSFNGRAPKRDPFRSGV